MKPFKVICIRRGTKEDQFVPTPHVGEIYTVIQVKYPYGLHKVFYNLVELSDSLHFAGLFHPIKDIGDEVEKEINEAIKKEKTELVEA